MWIDMINIMFNIMFNISSNNDIIINNIDDIIHNDV